MNKVTLYSLLLTVGYFSHTIVSASSPACMAKIATSADLALICTLTSKCPRNDGLEYQRLIDSPAALKTQAASLSMPTPFSATTASAAQKAAVAVGEQAPHLNAKQNQDDTGAKRLSDVTSSILLSSSSSASATLKAASSSIPAPSHAATISAAQKSAEAATQALKKLDEDEFRLIAEREKLAKTLKQADNTVFTNALRLTPLNPMKAGSIGLAHYVGPVLPDLINLECIALKIVINYRRIAYDVSSCWFYLHPTESVFRLAELIKKNYTRYPLVIEYNQQNIYNGGANKKTIQDWGIPNRATLYAYDFIASEEEFLKCIQPFIK